MCGIAGRLNLGSDEPVTREGVAAMCSVMVHRGPDEEGIYLDGAFGMGMRRLSIIDLAGGSQPIGNEDGSVWTVCNGEIYNFAELRSDLARRGHAFRTRSDTEVIVHLYEEHGEGFVEWLTGMFAIAVWDQRRRTLLLARDRLGIKPLYYFEGGGRLLFGSELKAVLAAGAPREIDPQALHDYLSLGYVPGPRSIFSRVCKLPPGHLLRAADGKVAIARYWDIDHSRAEDGGRARPEESWREELDQLLKTSVREHLVSDVPLGVFLSGGIDSGALVALMREVSAQKIRTFSIGFPEQSYDELDRARVVARRFGTEHHEMVIDPRAVDLLPELVRYFDEPFADSSAIPVYCVARLAREHVKVALAGDGGDEVFAGYETYAAYRVAEIYQRLPRLLATGVVPALMRRLPVSHRRVSFDYKARRFVQGATLPPAEGHYWWKVVFSEAAKAALYADGVDGRPNRGDTEDTLELYRRAYASCGAAETLVRLQEIDRRIYLPDDILVKADRMSMANSLEARVPLLDHRVVEFAAALPVSLKLRGLTKKYLLRKVMEGRLPRQIVRGKKRGFNVPMPVWLAGELRDMVHDVLSPARVRATGLFDAAAVSAVVRDHEEKREDRSRGVYALLVFMLWHDEYMRQ